MRRLSFRDVPTVLQGTPILQSVPNNEYIGYSGAFLGSRQSHIFPSFTINTPKILRATFELLGLSEEDSPQLFLEEIVGGSPITRASTLVIPFGEGISYSASPGTYQWFAFAGRLSSSNPPVPYAIYEARIFAD